MIKTHHRLRLHGDAINAQRLDHHLKSNTKHDKQV